MATSKILEKLDSSNLLYERIAQQMKNTIMMHDNLIPLRDYLIEQMFKINNDDLKNRFEVKKDEIVRDYQDCAVWPEIFHGSPYCYEIIQKGFNIDTIDTRSINTFGRGIYMAPHSSKANQYAFGKNQGCPMHEDIACKICTRKMLVSYCIMGRQFQPNAPTETIPAGCHSVVADPVKNQNIGQYLKYPEYCILHGDQILPYVLIEYRILDHDDFLRRPMRKTKIWKNSSTKSFLTSLYE